MNTRIKLFNTGFANAVGELGFGMFAEVFFEALPESPVVPDILAGGANGDQTTEDPDFLQCLLKLLVTASQIGFPLSAAVSLAFQRQCRTNTGEQVDGIDRLGDVIHGSRRKRLIQVVRVVRAGDHDDWNVAKVVLFFDVSTCGDAIEIRHMDIQQNQINGDRWVSVFEG